jgi:archaeal flagellar protein FlaI
LDDISLPRGWWGGHPSPPQPRSIVELIANRTLDAELAALLWLMVEARVSLIVAGEQDAVDRMTLLTASLDFLPPETRLAPLRGADDDFDWLPEARELGWTSARGPAARDDAAPASTRRPEARPTYMLAAELCHRSPDGPWGHTARVAVRALSLGYGLGTTIAAESLEKVFAALRRSPVGLIDDELSHLGVVLVLRLTGGVEPRCVVTAAHYVRPLARDQHGHVQRLGPAVLATHDERRDIFEHFAWGVVPELALRTGYRAGDFEAEQERRRDYLAGLAAGGVVEPAGVRTALTGYRHAAPAAAPPRSAHPH